MTDAEKIRGLADEQRRIARHPASPHIGELATANAVALDRAADALEREDAARGAEPLDTAIIGMPGRARGAICLGGVLALRALLRECRLAVAVSAPCSDLLRRLDAALDPARAPA